MTVNKDRDSPQDTVQGIGYPAARGQAQDGLVKGPTVSYVPKTTQLIPECPWQSSVGQDRFRWDQSLAAATHRFQNDF